MAVINIFSESCKINKKKPAAPPNEPNGQEQTEASREESGEAGGESARGSEMAIATHILQQHKELYCRVGD